MKLTNIFPIPRCFEFWSRLAKAKADEKREAWATQLQQRCDELTLQCRALDSEVITLKRRLNIERNRASAFQAAGLLLSPSVDTVEDLKRLYKAVAPWLDQGGHKLYQVANELTGCCGEELSMHLDDHEIPIRLNAYPGTAGKEHGLRKAHGQTRLRPQNSDSSEYQAYEHRLYRMVLQELGFRKFLSSA